MPPNFNSEDYSMNKSVSMAQFCHCTDCGFVNQDPEEMGRHFFEKHMKEYYEKEGDQ